MPTTNPGTTNLVAWWSLDEASGNRNDSHGVNHLTPGGLLSYATGKVGNAADFEGSTTDYLTIADNAAMRTGDIDWTYCLWVKAETLLGVGVYAGLVSRDPQSNNREMHIIYNGDVGRFFVQIFTAASTAAGRVQADSLGQPSVGVWYFIVVWHDAGADTLCIQVNGGAVDSAAESATVGPAKAVATEFGTDVRATQGRYWDGLIDEVGFWKRKLNEREIQWLYNGGNGRAYSETGVAPI